MDNQIKQIAEYYGYESQIDQMCEECAEFIVARSKVRRNVPGSWDNLIEEIADISIMVDQMKLIIGEDTINKVRARKIRRQILRIRKEKKNGEN